MHSRRPVVRTLLSSALASALAVVFLARFAQINASMPGVRATPVAQGAQEAPDRDGAEAQPDAPAGESLGPDPLRRVTASGGVVEVRDAGGVVASFASLEPEDGFGEAAAQLAGDLLAVGAPRSGLDAPLAGRVYILPTEPRAQARGPGAAGARAGAAEPTLAQRAAPIILTTGEQGARFGTGVAALEDPFGAPLALVTAPGAGGRGRAYLFDPLGEPDESGALAPIAEFEGLPGDSFGVAAERVDDSNGDGRADAAVLSLFVDESFNTRLRRQTFTGAGELLEQQSDEESPIVRLAGDLNGDGRVDAEDLGRLLSNFGRASGPGGVALPGDLNRDGVVDGADLSLLLGSFGEAADGFDAPQTLETLCTTESGLVFTCQDGTCDCINGGGEGDGVGPGDGDGDEGGGGDSPGGVDGTGATGGDGSGGGGTSGGDDDPPPPPPPDDGPSCSVTIDQPRPSAIGIWTPNDDDADDTNDTEDLPFLTATGSDPEGTYTWEIVPAGPDAGELEFVDLDPTDALAANEGPTVYLKGTKKSAALNDVQVKVTHTTADETCSETDMIELTVIAVTLTFRPVNPNVNPPEAWSPNNDVPQVPSLGHPQLGPANYNSPEGTQGYFKNIEIEARITPCVDGLEAVFDFKRILQGYDISVAFDGEQFWTLANLSEFFSPPDWWDDDAGNDDEDLRLEVDEGCVLYVVDSPGIPLPSIQCQQEFQNTQVHLLQCLNFREWLVADGFRASRTVEWHASTELVCTQLGSWLQANDFNGNKMGEGSIQCAPAPPLAGAQAGESQAPLNTFALQVNTAGAARPEPWVNDAPIVEALRQIESVNFFHRIRAAALIRSKIEAGLLTEFERASVIQTLLQILDNETDVPPGDLAHPHLTAIDLLGKLRAWEAALMLVEHINAEFARGAPREIDQLKPAVLALWRIGEPAILPIIEAIPGATEEEWRSLYSALRLLDESTSTVRREARDALRKLEQAAQPRDEEEAHKRDLFKSRLEEFLSTPEPRRMPMRQQPDPPPPAP